MDSEKAKTILIIILLFLNAGLFSLNYYGKTEKRITAEEISAIKNILSQNNIELDCELPSDGSPARLITVAEAVWDADLIRDTFFVGEGNVIRTNESGSVIYRSNDKTVRISNALSPGKPVTLTVEAALKDGQVMGHEISARYKEALGERFSSYRLYRAIADGERETYIYNDTVDDRAVFSSYIRADIYADTLFLTIKKYDFISYVEGVNQIYRADEALLAFMHYADKAFERKITVEGITLGYDIDEYSSAEEYKGRLYYRIFISGMDEPVYIDAVTNTVYNREQI